MQGATLGMEFKLKLDTLDAHPIIDINDAKFCKLLECKGVLSAALAIEEKYELLLSNYLELEKQALNTTVERMLYNSHDYSDSFDNRIAFNQRIVNLLTSTKLYIDQIQQHVRNCIPTDITIADSVKQLFSTEYDEVFEYRFMEAMRNYVQHRGLAVHLIRYNSKWTSIEEHGQMECTVKLFAQKNEVENDKAFKKAVTKEMPQEVDLIFASRRYVESISKAHVLIRKMINQPVMDAREILSQEINDYKKMNNGNALGLTAYSICNQDNSNDVVKKFGIFLDWDDVRIKLTQKNSGLVNLHKRYVSGTCI